MIDLTLIRWGETYLSHLYMIAHEKLTTSELVRLLKSKKIVLAGNKKLKIYGSLDCRSGKRMKKMNRVFFTLSTLWPLHENRLCVLEREQETG
jgi:hypothetical protein